MARPEDVGLSSVRRRLQSLYGDRHSCRVGEREGGSIPQLQGQHLLRRFQENGAILLAIAVEIAPDVVGETSLPEIVQVAGALRECETSVGAPVRGAEAGDVGDAERVGRGVVGRQGSAVVGDITPIYVNIHITGYRIVGQ